MHINYDARHKYDARHNYGARHRCDARHTAADRYKLMLIQENYYTAAIEQAKAILSDKPSGLLLISSL